MVSEFIWLNANSSTRAAPYKEYKIQISPPPGEQDQSKAPPVPQGQPPPHAVPPPTGFDRFVT